MFWIGLKINFEITRKNVDWFGINIPIWRAFLYYGKLTSAPYLGQFATSSLNVLDEIRSGPDPRLWILIDSSFLLILVKKSRNSADILLSIFMYNFRRIFTLFSLFCQQKKCGNTTEKWTAEFLLFFYLGLNYTSKSTIIINITM